MVEFTLLQTTPAPAVALLIFIFTIAFYLLGHRTRARIIRGDATHREVDLGPINGMLLGLLGLLLAFTFSMSNSRFDNRRQLVIEEANNIGTVILRTDVYPDSVRSLLRGKLREYVKARIAFYQSGMDVSKTVTNYLKADSLGRKIWQIVTTYAKVDNITTRTSEMIPALNAMIDITTTRRAAGEATIPDSIMYFLFLLCLTSAFLLGYDNKTKMDWVVVTGFAFLLSATVFNIIDLDRPRGGFITMDGPNKKIIELLDLFDQP